MPRSFVADRFERHSLNRAEKASLGRYSVGTDISLGSAATQHWVNSVSDIYGPDEIEELLEDLNRLEMASFDGDDFDIDGSQIGGYGQRHTHHPSLGHTHQVHIGGGGGGIGLEGGGPLHPNRSPQSSDDQLVTATANQVTASPTWSIKSWDSHTHYQEFKEPEDDPVFFPSRPMQSIICYCDMATFKAPTTILRVLLVVTSIACLSTLLTAGTAKAGLFALPHFPRLRLMLFVTIFAIIFTTFVLFLNISHLHALLPVDYAKLQTVAYMLLTVAYLVASSLVLHSHQTGFDNDDDHLPNSTKTQILIASLLGFLCSIGTFLCSFNCGPPPPSYDKMAESSTHFTLHETVTPRAVTTETIPPPNPSSGATLAQHAHRPTAPPAMRHSKSGGSCPPVPPNQRHHQYLVNENYDSDRVVTGAARALSSSASQQQNANHNHKSKDASHNGKNNNNNNNNNGKSALTQDPLNAVQHSSSTGKLPNPTSCSKSMAQTQPHHSSSSVSKQPQSRTEPNEITSSGPGRQTGAIPKQKQKNNKALAPNSNHLDEILALPLDDL